MKGAHDRIRLGRWRTVGASLEEHVEAGSLRVGKSVYVIGGYQTLTRMCERMQIFDMGTCEWSYGPQLPRGFPLSHAGLASDGRFLFVISGQPGPACEPASAHSWALDLVTMTWIQMAPLPVARYAPLLEYVDGNLHLISGAIEDRETISTDHFILKIRDRATKPPLTLPTVERQIWRKGAPVPKGGDHAGSVVLDGKIYVVGGEHGHAAMTMVASKCCGTYWVHNYLFRYDPEEDQWDRLADMPFGSSHMESQIAIVDNRLIVLGGTGDKDIFVDRVQEYDPVRNRWRQMKRLPHARKGGVVWETNGYLYFNGGQMMSTAHERTVVAETMSARIKRRRWLAFLG